MLLCQRTCTTANEVQSRKRKPNHQSRRRKRRSSACSQEIGRDQRSLLHALAFAANEDSGHSVGGFASLGHGSVGPVPAGVLGVMAGRASFAVAALATSAAMQDDFLWARRPVL